MSEIDNSKLMDLVIEKHNKFLETFKTEFSELETKLDSIKKQSDALKKEIETNELKSTVLNEKYFLFFHMAKKQRDELFNNVLSKMREVKASNIQDIVRLSSRIEEYENKLKNSRNIDDEEKAIKEITNLLLDFENETRKAGIIASSKVIVDKLNEANASHKELLSIKDKPQQDVNSVKEFDKQISEIEGRHNWLKRRVESHSNALSYWEKQKGGIKVE